MINNKEVVVGLGEIGKPIFNLIKKNTVTVGYDVDPKLFNEKLFLKYESLEVNLLHICIPFTDNFITNIISLSKKFHPKGIVIHSTVKPYTTKTLQSKLSVPVIYSATRGVHKRMISDLKKYVKFFSLEKDAPKRTWAIKEFSKIMKKSSIKTKLMSEPITLELAKIVCDTSYYGWLITYAQISNMIAIKNNVDYDEMWSFASEIHKFLGNRPKMFPGFIGGHCVIPNLQLIDNEALQLIDEINNNYGKILKSKSSL